MTKESVMIGSPALSRICYFVHLEPHCPRSIHPLLQPDHQQARSGEISPYKAANARDTGWAKIHLQVGSKS